VILLQNTHFRVNCLLWNWDAFNQLVLKVTLIFAYVV